jgi:hypothetical protein
MVQSILIMVATIGIAVGFGAIAIGVFRVLSARKEQQRQAVIKPSPRSIS